MVFAVLAGTLAGASVVISRMLNASLGMRLGNMRATFYNYATGLAGSILVLLISRAALPRALSGSWNFTMYLGGLMGVVSVVLFNFVTPRMSAYVLTLVVFVSQLGSGMLLDALTGVPVSWGKALGGALVLAGLVYNQSLDRKKVATRDAGGPPPAPR